MNEPVYSVDESLANFVRVTHRSFTRALEKRLTSHGITTSMWYFLRLLWERDGRIQKDLGTDTDLQPSTVVNAVDNLERLKLIYRQRNEADRRKVNVFLTDAGRALMTQLTAHALEVNQLAMSDLSDREQATLWKLLRKVQSALAEDH